MFGWLELQVKWSSTRSISSHQRTGRERMRLRYPLAVLHAVSGMYITLAASSPLPPPLSAGRSAAPSLSAPAPVPLLPRRPFSRPSSSRLAWAVRRGAGTVAASGRGHLNGGGLGSVAHRRVCECTAGCDVRRPAADLTRAEFLRRVGRVRVGRVRFGPSAWGQQQDASDSLEL